LTLGTLGKALAMLLPPSLASRGVNMRGVFIFGLMILAFTLGCAGRSAAETSGNPAPSAGSSGQGTDARDWLSPTFVQGHQLIIPEALVTKSGLPLSKIFSTLHQERRWAEDEIQLLEATLHDLSSRPHSDPPPVPEVSEQKYQAGVAELDGKIGPAEQQQRDPRLTSEEQDAAHLKLLELVRQKAKLIVEYQEYKSYETTKNGVTQTRDEETKTKKDLSDTVHYLASVDDAINSILLTSEKDNYFRVLLGVGFVGLVGLMIIGFFFAAWRAKSLEASFFTSDRGLQFIALFSLIIAVILFGMMNVLEGKELSALLGAISGYILGRTTSGGGSASPANR
jgi:hypothetical protein